MNLSQRLLPLGKGYLKRIIIKIGCCFSQATTLFIIFQQPVYSFKLLVPLGHWKNPLQISSACRRSPGRLSPAVLANRPR
ncbi:hypothetical protein SKAU_G00385940 [Synaphobranchus kaupii]|uniref:Uncharacterized protein n=1 Tax=Synaphobranchus kaupii TaxID=118154 RepID=A0A9Q1EEL2_SYNKA|nr:hypothetical protein SKAU_G00385940 [Synaphobranchus kaupii]